MTSGKARPRSRQGSRPIEPPGELLRSTRERAHLSQHELAQRLGVTQHAVAQAERRQSNPTLAFVRRWVKSCGATLSLLIRWRSP